MRHQIKNALALLFPLLILVSCLENKSNDQVKNDDNDFVGMYVIFEEEKRPLGDEKIAIESELTKEFNVNVPIDSDSENSAPDNFALAKIFSVQKKRIPDAPDADAAGDKTEPKFTETLISKKPKTPQELIAWVAKDRLQKKLHNSATIDLSPEFLPKKLKNKASIYYVSRSDVDFVTAALVSEGYEVTVKTLKRKDIPDGADPKAFAGHQVLMVKAKPAGTEGEGLAPIDAVAPPPVAPPPVAPPPVAPPPVAPPPVAPPPGRVDGARPTIPKGVYVGPNGGLYRLSPAIFYPERPIAFRLSSIDRPEMPSPAEARRFAVKSLSKMSASAKGSRSDAQIIEESAAAYIAKARKANDDLATRRIAFNAELGERFSADQNVSGDGFCALYSILYGMRKTRGPHLGSLADGERAANGLAAAIEHRVRQIFNGEVNGAAAENQRISILAALRSPVPQADFDLAMSGQLRDAGRLNRLLAVVRHDLLTRSAEMDQPQLAVLASVLNRDIVLFDSATAQRTILASDGGARDGIRPDAISIIRDPGHYRGLVPIEDAAPR